MKNKFKILTPYDLEKNLGAYYNREIHSLPNNDWSAVFVDSDCMFTTDFFGHQINHILEKYPEAGLFTAVTNRVGSKYLCVDGMFEETNMVKHFQKGKELYETKYDQVTDITDADPISGMCFIIRRSTWQKMGRVIEEKGKALGIDNDFHYKVKSVGEKIYRMDGVYVLHKYRMLQGVKDKSHLL